MKAQRITIGLTALNVLLLLMTVFRVNTAAAPDTAPILRCRELYLVDDKGRVRAELKVTPPQPNLKMPDGSVGFPNPFFSGSSLPLGTSSSSCQSRMLRASHSPFPAVSLKPLSPPSVDGDRGRFEPITNPQTRYCS